ncbi:MAG: LysM peptidoglycan-binding domain-containing protein, partial [Gemmatimonadota bacterium]
HGVESHQLRWYNPKLRATKSGVLTAGQTVVVPTPNTVEGAFDVPSPEIERYGTSASGRHLVRRGETLGGIARRYGTTVNTLMRWNGLRKPVIYAGQSIVVRGTARRATRTASGS